MGPPPPPPVSPPPRKFAIGIGYPFISLKYSPSQSFSLEGKGIYSNAMSGEIWGFGGRAYINLLSHGPAILFAGGEYYWIDFNTNWPTPPYEVDGTAGLLYGFVGGELFLGRRFSLCLDVGVCYARVSDERFTSSGLHYLGNLGVYLYLF